MLELEAVKQQKEEEAIIFENLTNKKIELETKFSAFLVKEKDKEFNIADKLIAKRKEVARARASATGGG